MVYLRKKYIWLNYNINNLHRNEVYFSITAGRCRVFRVFECITDRERWFWNQFYVDEITTKIFCFWNWSSQNTHRANLEPARNVLVFGRLIFKLPTKFCTSSIWHWTPIDHSSKRPFFWIRRKVDIIILKISSHLKRFSTIKTVKKCKKISDK